MAFDVTKLGEWFVPGYFSDATAGGANEGTYKISATELRSGLTTVREGGALDLTAAPGGGITLPASHEIFTLAKDVANSAAIDAGWSIGGNAYTTSEALRAGQAVALLATGVLVPLGDGNSAHYIGNVDLTTTATGAPFHKGDIINNTKAGTAHASWPGVGGNAVDTGKYIFDGTNFVALSGAGSSGGMKLLHASDYETDVSTAATGAVKTDLALDHVGDWIKVKADTAKASVHADFGTPAARDLYAGELLISDGVKYQPLPYMPFDISKLPATP